MRSFLIMLFAALGAVQIFPMAYFMATSTADLLQNYKNAALLAELLVLTAIEIVGLLIGAACGVAVDFGLSNFNLLPYNAARLS